MKHRGPSEDMLLELLAESGVSVPVGTLPTMLRHIDWLLRTNEQLNLTAITDPAEALRLHVVDSLLALPEVAQAQPGLLVDVGTGGGFPGLELALASRRDAVLVDSVAKKATALGGFLLHESLESRISVSSKRSEELALERPGLAAVVTARAVAELPALVELAAPLLSLGGGFVALKGDMLEEELERGVSAAERCGLVQRGFRTTALPRGGEIRTIVTFERVGEPQIGLPRRPGMATKRPLA